MEIAALILSVIAILVSVVTLPSAFQMFWGGPLLRFDFSELDGSDGRRLYCEISNIPIQNQALRRLGVRREPAVISARYLICEAGSNRIMLDTAQAHLVDIAGSSGEGTIRATVTDHLGVMFTCALHLNDKDHSITVDPLKKTSVILSPGRFASTSM